MLVRSFRIGNRFVIQMTKSYMEGEGDSGGDDKGGDDKGGDDKGGKGKAPEFTPEQQKYINDVIIAKRFKKEREQTERLSEQLKTLKENKNLSDKEREDLQTRIDDLDKSLMTKEEQAAKERKGLEEKYSKEVKKHSEEANVWKSRYTTSMLERSLTDAAIEANAESPEQIKMMFVGGSYLSEDKDDDGKATGTFTPKMKFQGLDPNHEGEGTPKRVNLDLPINEAIQKIKKDGLNGNLFKHDSKSGTGKGGGGKGGGSQNAMPTLDQFGGDHKKYSAAYQKWREDFNYDGTSKKK